jgi:hypothetical protein
MKKIIFTTIAIIVSLSCAAQVLPRLHVKTNAQRPAGITTGTATNKVVGINHDGTSGIISTTTVNGLANAPSPLKFATSGLTRLTIFENGYVGINLTSTPTAELTVGGKIHAKEVKVSVNAGQVPDYVFHSTYRLRPLKELSVYIDENGHLPEVPSAAVMEQDGVNTGEMNMLLLKKIEELTLYMIEQNGKLEALNEKLRKHEMELENLRKN